MSLHPSSRRRGAPTREKERKYFIREGPMTISEKQIRRIAHLARLQIEDSDIPVYTQNLSNILKLVDQLQSVNTKDIQPMSHPLDLTQRLREDKVTETDQRDLFQKSAPLIEASLYIVPQVIEEG